MKIQLMHENLNSNEKMRIIKNITEEKIRILEEKISLSDNIEDIKLREKNIKFLQQHLMEVQESLKQNKVDDLLIFI